MTINLQTVWHKLGGRTWANVLVLFESHFESTFLPLNNEMIYDWTYRSNFNGTVIDQLGFYCYWSSWWRRLLMSVGHGGLTGTVCELGTVFGAHLLQSTCARPQNQLNSLPLRVNFRSQRDTDKHTDPGKVMSKDVLIKVFKSWHHFNERKFKIPPITNIEE